MEHVVFILFFIFVIIFEVIFGLLVDLPGGSRNWKYQIANWCYILGLYVVVFTRTEWTIIAGMILLLSEFKLPAFWDFSFLIQKALESKYRHFWVKVITLEGIQKIDSILTILVVLVGGIWILFL